MANHFSIKKNEIRIGKYSNGRTALRVFDSEDGCPVATLTVNIPGVKLNGDEVIIKSYAENAGVLKELQELGIVHSEYRTIPYGFKNPAICTLLKADFKPV